MVELLPSKENVACSSHVACSTGCYSQKGAEADCKSAVLTGSVGSTPTASTTFQETHERVNQ